MYCTAPVTDFERIEMKLCVSFVQPGYFISTILLWYCHIINVSTSLVCRLVLLLFIVWTFMEINKAEDHWIRSTDYHRQPLETCYFSGRSGVCKIWLRLDMFHILQILSLREFTGLGWWVCPFCLSTHHSTLFRQYIRVNILCIIMICSLL